jgi:hypothetical protein
LEDFMESRWCPDHVGKGEFKLLGKRGGMTSATPKRTLAGGNEEALPSSRKQHREAVVPAWNEPDLFFEPVAVLRVKGADAAEFVQAGSRRSI